MKKSLKILISLLFAFTILICCNMAKVNAADMSYETHVQDIGWQGAVSDGETAGTSGQAKRLEAIMINLNGQAENAIEYRTHIQDIGWQDWKHNGELSGTEGEAKRLEAIQIKLNGDIAKKYNIIYRVHVQDIGWQDWKYNGELAGTEGQAKRLEAIQIKLVKRGKLEYQTHVQDIGWQRYVADGETAGTSGQSKRLESIRINLNTSLDGSIIYSTHIQDIGWQEEKRDNELSGTEGQSKRLEGIKIRLDGEISDFYDVYYRVHVQDIGWQDWKHNGEMAGTEGQSKRLEAIEIVLSRKYFINYEFDGGDYTNGENPNPLYYTERTEDFELIAPTKTGYTFDGWLDGENKMENSIIRCSDKEDKEIKATWVPNKYTVNFDTNGGDLEKQEDKSKTITYDSAYGELPTPTRKGYTFKGWVTERPEDMQADLNTQDSMLPESERIDEEDIVKITDTQTLYAQWQVTTYTITYNGMENAVQNVDNPDTYTILDADISINAPTKEGHTFDGWTGTNLQNKQKNIYIASGSVGNREYLANWTVNKYTATFVLDNGEENIVKTQDYGTTLTAPTPEKTGYRIATWQVGGVDSEVPETMPAENITYKANWELSQFTATFNLNNGEENVVKTQDYGTALIAPVPEKAGYTFAGWDREVSETMPAENITYNANWSVIEYTLTYNLNDSTEEPASVQPANPVKYTVETQSFTLKNPTRKDYVFIGWTGTDLTEPTMQVTIPTSKLGNKEYTANWACAKYYVRYQYKSTGSTITDEWTYGEFRTITRNPDQKRGYTVNSWENANNNKEIFKVGSSYKNLTNTKAIDLSAHEQLNIYNITYNLNDTTGNTSKKASLESGKTNPSTYNVEESTITLNNPIREGYTFAGWIETINGAQTSGKLMNVSFDPRTKQNDNENCALGDRTYTATWTPVVYSIGYTLNGGTVATSNPTTFTVESSNITLNNPTRAHYTFTGWTGTDLASATTNVTIDTSKIGNKLYTANWTPVEYTVSYNLNGGTVSPSNPVKFTVENSNITLNNPTKEGYNFTGWTGTDLSAATTNVTITTSNGGNKSYTANWTPIVYSIGYTLNGGTVTPSNQTEYTIESNNITLKNPTKDNYTFWGWTGTGLTAPTRNVTIAKGSKGNRNYVANFEKTWVMDTTYTSWLSEYNGLDNATVSLPTNLGISHIKTGAFASSDMQTLDLTTISQVSLGKDAVKYNENEKLTLIKATSRTNDLVKQTNVTYGWKDVLGIEGIEGLDEDTSTEGKIIYTIPGDTQRTITIQIID